MKNESKKGTYGPPLDTTALPLEKLQCMTAALLAAIKQKRPKTEIALLAALVMESDVGGESEKPTVTVGDFRVGLSELLAPYFQSVNPGVAYRALKQLQACGLITLQNKRIEIETDTLGIDLEPRELDTDLKTQQEPQESFHAIKQNRPALACLDMPVAPSGKSEELDRQLANVINELGRTHRSAVDELEVLQVHQRSGRLYLTVPSDLIRDHLAAKYSDALQAAWKKQIGAPAPTLITRDDLPPLPQDAKPATNSPVEADTKTRDNKRRDNSCTQTDTLIEKALAAAPAPSGAAVDVTNQHKEDQSLSTVSRQPENISEEWIETAMEHILASPCRVSSPREVLEWLIHIVFLRPKDSTKYTPLQRLRGPLQWLHNGKLSKPSGFCPEKVTELLLDSGIDDVTIYELTQAGKERSNGIPERWVGEVERLLYGESSNTQRKRIPLPWVLFAIFLDPGHPKWAVQNRLKSILKMIDEGRFRQPTAFSRALVSKHLDQFDKQKCASTKMCMAA